MHGIYLYTSDLNATGEVPKLANHGTAPYPQYQDATDKGD
jgi:hypothetical protein